MNDHFASVPLIDRSDFDSLLAEHRFGRWDQQARDMHNFGYCVLDISGPSVDHDCDHLIEAFGDRLANDLAGWEAGTSGSMRIQDGWKEEPAVRRLALHPLVLDLLRHLYGRDPFAFQTLNFAVGSQQPYHSDAVHFHCEPHGFMCGVWIPLADVQPDSGPLVYYPSSHRLPYRSAASLGLTPEQVSAEAHPQRFFEPGWQEDVQRLGLTPQLFLPGRGQALIWHANLLHGGSPVVNRRARRWSQVIHFYFKGCLYTTPMKSFGPRHGGACFRSPVDIETGSIVDLPSQRAEMDIGAGHLSVSSSQKASRRSALSQRVLTRLLSLSEREDGKRLKGNIELISPSLVTGWLYHPDYNLTDVRLVCGSELVAATLIDEHRPDVNAALDLKGIFGFRMSIPDSHPEPDQREPVQLLALTADGSSRFAVKLSGHSVQYTESLLRMALASSYRGLRGHFDGLSLSQKELTGWCFSPFISQPCVWLHADGLNPLEIPCCSHRPSQEGFDMPEDCGFRLHLSQWPEAAGRRVWASFDAEGELRLPPASFVQLPENPDYYASSP